MFRLEIPSYGHKEEAIEYIKEFIEYNSEINGTGSLDSYLDSYEEWIDKLRKIREVVSSEASVPSDTYFMIREEDNRIIGMCNVRLGENAKILSAAGHIG